jgi:hypothetical protein
MHGLRSSQMLCGRRNQEEWGRRGMWNVRGRQEPDTALGGETWRKRPTGRPRSRWEDTIRAHLKELCWKGVKQKYLVPQDENGCGTLWIWKRTVGFNKRRGSSAYSEELRVPASHEGLCSTALVIYLKYLRIHTWFLKQGTSSGGDSRPVSRNSTYVVKI